MNEDYQCKYFGRECPYKGVEFMKKIELYKVGEENVYSERHRTDTGRTPVGLMGTLGGLLYEAESIFNVIFEIYAVFTCYLTYYKPSAKKSW